jgi:hypothetical protein
VTAYAGIVLVGSKSPAGSQSSWQPPSGPWVRLRQPVGNAGGFVTVYLSDDIARYPIRAVTKPRDNKSDPNLETGTYGLFSTCQVRMRKSVVQKGVPYIFFVTTHTGHARVLTGMYQIGWYAPGPDRDFALAAESYRFVEPVALGDLPSDLSSALTLRRGYKAVTNTEAKQLAEFLSSRSSLNQRYLDEIARVEQLSIRRTGFRYPTWRRTDGWSWDDAGVYLTTPAVVSSRAVANRSPGDIWQCIACTERIVNKARLKRCPMCGAIGTLRPLSTEA